MKNITKYIIVLILVCLTKITFAQVNGGTVGIVRPGTGTWILGWDGSGGNTGTLEIKNGFSSDINFTTSTTQKATILANGNVGIGIATPNNLLHINNSAGGSNVYAEFTTGSTGNGGLQIGITHTSNNEADINQKENGPMNFYTTGVQRIAIKGGSSMATTAGYVGIGNGFPSPASRLHIREDVSGIDTWLQLTSDITGHTDANGLRIGVTDAAGNVEIKQQYNADMNFYTNSLQRAVIKNSGKVGINVTSPSALLESSLTGGSGTNSTYHSTLTNSTASATNYGAQIDVTGTSATTNYGMYVTSLGGGSGADSYGGYFKSENSTHDVVGIYVNALGKASSANNHIYGVEAHAAVGSSGGSATFTYGVYSATTSNCNASTCTAAAGYFDGDLAYTGSFVKVSDAALKLNIMSLDDPMAILKKLKPKSFEYDLNNNPQMNLPSGLQFGLLAQDVYDSMPQFTKDLVQPAVIDDQGNTVYPDVHFKGISEVQFISVLIASQLKQQHTIDSLLAALAGNPIQNQGNGQQKQQKPGAISVELSNENSIILDQNDPNPFSDQTNIHYFIPDNVSSAKIMFYDNNGHVLRTVDILEKGEGNITVYASQLKNGIYQYSLIADGKTIESKKMVKN